MARVKEIIAAIEEAAPGGRITAGGPVPFPLGVDSASFPSSSAARVSRPLEAGVAEAIERLQVEPPPSTAPSEALPTRRA